MPECMNNTCNGIGHAFGQLNKGSYEGYLLFFMKYTDIGVDQIYQFFMTASVLLVPDDSLFRPMVLTMEKI